MSVNRAPFLIKKIKIVQKGPKLITVSTECQNGEFWSGGVRGGGPSDLGALVVEKWNVTGCASEDIPKMGKHLERE